METKESISFQQVAERAAACFYFYIVNSYLILFKRAGLNVLPVLLFNFINDIFFNRLTKVRYFQFSGFYAT